MDIKFSLESIAETEYRFNFDFDYATFDDSKIHYQFSQNLKKKDSDILNVSASVRLVYGDDDIELLRNTVMLTFYVSPLDEILVSKDDESYESKHQDVIDTFLNITIGSLRGILYKNTKETPLKKVVLPLIPRDMFHKKNERKSGK